MKAASRWLQHLATALVGGTGAVYAFMVYALEPAEPWDVLHHPWQAHVQHLHVIAAPLLVFAIGVAWAEHARERLADLRPRLSSALGLVATAAPMVLSGYLLQVTSEPAWRAVWSYLHTASGVLWILGYLAHVPWRRAAKGGPHRVLAAALALTLLACSTPQRPTLPRETAPTPAPVVRRVVLMGTYLTLEVHGEAALAARASEAALAAIEGVEARLSTWREDSELSRLNTAADGTSTLSAELAHELDAALACARRTGGAFDPTLATLVAAHGLRTGGRVPSELELVAARERAGHQRVRLARDRIEKPVGLGFEEGGFGKGVALDAAAATLRAWGIERAVLDLGGQWLVLGGGAWVPVAAPDARDDASVLVWVEDGSLATTGNGVARDSGLAAGHVLDPRTGRLVDSRDTVSVLAPTAALADCLSTGLFVLGGDAALAHAAAHEDVAVLVQTHGTAGAKLRTSANLRVQHALNRDDDAR